MVDTNHMDVVVLGAGIIGTLSALELVKTGKNVTLIDRQIPGSATSLGNAGVINRGSIIPFNNPALLRQLPALLTHQKTGFDYKLSYVFDELSWGLRFLSHCTQKDTLSRAAALNQLISRSADIYREYLSSDLLSEKGWLKIYRGTIPDNDSIELVALLENNVRFEKLESDELNDLEPAIQGNDLNGLWIKDTMALKDPQKTVLSFAQLFENHGGDFVRSEIRELNRENGVWSIELSNQNKITAENILIALGPWSKDFLETLNIQLPMAYERGAHREFEEGPNSLNRPIHDTDGGYVISPLEKRWRVTCGVELAPIDAPRSTQQMDTACQVMKKIIKPGPHIEKPDWLGSRPTLPDSLPAIGAMKINNLWVSTGHQHIGMASAAASAELITDLIVGRKPKIDAAAFSPSRFDI